MFASSGRHVGIVTTPELTVTLRESILHASRAIEANDEDDEDDEDDDNPYDTVTIHENVADENDHYFCFSGPPDDDELATYRINTVTNTLIQGGDGVDLYGLFDQASS
jgi:hypothetical protein